MIRTRRNHDEAQLGGVITAILGWTHLLVDDRVELTRDDVRTVARRIAQHAARLEVEWCGTSNFTTGGTSKSRQEAIASATRALEAAGSPMDVLGILCEAVHDLGGWVEPDHGQTGSACVIDLGVSSVPVLHAQAPVGSRARLAVTDDVAPLVAVGADLARALDRERQLAGLDLDALDRDPLTGVLDQDALDEVLPYIGPRHVVLALRLHGLSALAGSQGRAVADLHVRRLAGLLNDQVRGYDLVFRSDPDTFVFLGLADRAGTQRLGARIVAAWHATDPQAALFVAGAVIRGRTGAEAVEVAMDALAPREAGEAIVVV